MVNWVVGWAGKKSDPIAIELKMTNQALGHIGQPRTPYYVVLWSMCLG